MINNNNQNEINNNNNNQNPLNSFVTQVSKGSGIPLSPKTASNVAKIHKLEEKISQNTHIDLHPQLHGIPKSYLSQSNQKQNNENEKKNKNQLQIQKSVPTGNKQFLYYVSSLIKAYQESQDESNCFNQLARDHLIQTMQAISFSRILKTTPQKIIDEKKVYLQNRRDNKKTIIFDLDETLIHCNENVSIPSDVILPIRFPTGEIIEAGINIRPYCLECLQELSKYYEIVIFTASHSCYANVVLDYLDPKGQYISYRLYRENCVTTEEGVYIKDLRVIQNRNLSDIVLVDNAAYSFGFQINNGIPIIPFYDNKNDNELKHLINFMKQLNQVKDMRDALKKLLKINQFCEFQDPELLLSTLFQEQIQ